MKRIGAEERKGPFSAHKLTVRDAGETRVVREREIEDRGELARAGARENSFNHAIGGISREKINKNFEAKRTSREEEGKGKKGNGDENKTRPVPTR